jgi:hypothetical protein
MGIKSITTHLNERNIRTRDGGRWGIASVHQILTRTTYIGEHRFNTRDHKTRTAKPKAEHAVMAVPPIITEAEYHAVKAALKARSPQWMPPRGQRIHLTDRNLLLLILRRRDDAPDREKQPISLTWGRGWSRGLFRGLVALEIPW